MYNSSGAAEACCLPATMKNCLSTEHVKELSFKMLFFERAVDLQELSFISVMQILLTQMLS